MTPEIFLGIVLFMFAVFGVPEDANETKHVTDNTIIIHVTKDMEIIDETFDEPYVVKEGETVEIK